MNVWILFLIVLFGIFIPLSSHAQSNDVTVEEIHNLLESIESANERNQNETMTMISNFNQTSTRLFENLLSILTVNQDASNLTNITLKEIENLLKKNQLRSEETQLANSLIQVSGIFVAIIGGFITTKILSSATERNRIRRKLSETESDISNRKTVIKHYRDIVNNLGTKWAEEDINDFRQKLLNEPTLKEFSKKELIEKYEEDKRRSADLHELQVFDEQYDEIISEIKSKIEERKKPTPFPEILGLANLSRTGIFPILRPARDYEPYAEADEQWKFEESNVSHLEDQKNILEDDLTDLRSPDIWKSAIIFLSIAVFLGIIMPSIWQFFKLENPLVAALVGFLVVFIIFIVYLGFEIRKTLKIVQIDM